MKASLRIIVGVLALSFAALSARAQTPDKPVGSAAQPYPNNEWNVTEADGSKNRIVRWAVGARDQVEILRIPQGYLDPIMFAGCSGFGPNYPEPNCRQPYSIEILLRAMLPDFAPVPNRKLSKDEEARIVHIKLDSILWGRVGRTERDDLRSLAKISLDMMKTGPLERRFAVGYKESRFGLARVGLLHNLGSRDVRSFYDFYFVPRDPNALPDPRTCAAYEPDPSHLKVMSGLRICEAWLETQDFLTCTVDEVPTRDVSPDFPGLAQCNQVIAASNLSAVATVRYERQFLGHWQEIKERTLGLLSSFKTSEMKQK